MDAKAIVREMVKNGQGKAEITANLQELGIPDAEKYYDEAIAEEGKGTIRPEIGDSSDAEKEAKDILESETKPLFGAPQEHPIGKKPSDDEKKRVDKAVEEIPELEITNIDDEGEKTRDIQEMLGKKKAEREIMGRMPVTSFQNLDEVERKMDELVSMLRAVYEIDKKILDANREVLLRLKTEKTQ